MSALTEPPSGQASVRPPPTDLPAFLPFACKQLEAPFTIKVIKRVQDVYVSKIETSAKKYNKSKLSLARSQPTVAGESSSEEREPPAAADESELALTAVLDPAGRPVELQLPRGPAPCRLLQLLALCLPHQAYLARLTARRAQLNGAALYEMGKMLAVSYLTELCLDDSPVPQRNYGALLAAHTPLRHLSLDRCDIDDDDCAALVAHIAHPLPASRRLAALSLASNAIADPGACAIGRVLRTNRALLHLNLSGNRITNDGAAGILASLGEFALTPEESVSTRCRRLNYLKLKRKTYAELYAELSSAAAEDVARAGRRRNVPRAGRKSSGTSLPTSGGGGGGVEAVAARAEAMTLELVGSYWDPFGGAEVVSRGGSAWCAGNTALCSLGPAYNALGHETLARLRRVLGYQRARAERGGGGGWGCGAGLVRVALEGNPLPGGGEALRVSELLRGAVERLAGARGARGRDKPVVNKLKVTLPK